MKLKHLIDAFASEIELAQSRLDYYLNDLASLDAENPVFMVALDEYSGQAQRMGEAAEMAGFPGLQWVCSHVVENSLMLAAQLPEERGAAVDFLRAWPSLIVHYLQNLSDPSTAAGLIDHLSRAPYPMGADLAMKVMHMLGAMPLQVGLHNEKDTHRPVLATVQDVALQIPADVDEKFMEGFFQEAPDQARQLVVLARSMVSGEVSLASLAAAKRLTHTLKGSGATIGLRGITSMSHYLEDIFEYFESEHVVINQQAANALLDAAYCLEQMIGFVTGHDDFPQQAQLVLQTVLDLANRIDCGESLDDASKRVASTLTVVPDALIGSTAAPSKQAHTELAGTPGIALRVSQQRIEDMFVVSSQIAVNSAAMEAHVKALLDSSRELLGQNMRLQKRLFELDTIVEVRTLAMMRSHNRRSEDTAFDPLEMDQYNELHSTSHALAEEAADARSMATKIEEGIAKVGSQQARQQQLSEDLQHLVLSTRMDEVGGLESRLQRNVRTVCQATGKDALLLFKGGNTLIDRDLLRRLAEPLLHLLRNAVDHGLESPDERIAAGKSSAGHIELNFSRQGQQVVLRCQDDGRGLNLAEIQQRAVQRGLLAAEQTMTDSEIARLILLPGFSTRHVVSEVSGRGIGLDVVRDWVSAMNGTIQIDSKPGFGCTFELRFAASLSTVQSLIVAAAGERFALPSVQIERAVASGVGSFEWLGRQFVYRLNKRTYPAERLANLAGLSDAMKPLKDYSAVIVRLDHKTQVLAVDQLLDARELLVNNPGRYARHVRGISGMSILGDGGIAVNLDLGQLFAGDTRIAVAARTARVELNQRHLPRVLIVDDSLSVRNSLLQLVQDAGYCAATARDGIDAVDTLRTFKPNVVLTDLEMPNMNGVELTYHIRDRDDLKALPIIMITSRSQDKHRQMAEQAGVSHYITKPYNEGFLLQVIRSTITH